mgnify:CR=1 FL=1
MSKDLPTEEWNKENVVSFIMFCRSMEGIPHFVSGKPKVLARCWGGRGPEISRYFKNVPEEDFKLIKESFGDWRKLLKKYAPEKLYEAERYGIYIPGFKLPKIRGD